MSFSYTCDKCGWKTKNVKEIKYHKCPGYSSQQFQSTVQNQTEKPVRKEGETSQQYADRIKAWKKEQEKHD